MPPIDELAVTWAAQAKDAWQAGDRERARECARKAIAAHERFGSKKVAEPQIVAACRRLLDGTCND
jgi:hypothetical protein